MEYKLTAGTRDNMENRENFKSMGVKILELDDRVRVVFEKDKSATDDDIEAVYVEINNVFKEIEIDKKSGGIANIDFLMNRWLKLKKDIVFNTDEEMLIHFMIELSRYYEDREYLEFVLKNFSVIPFLLLINLNDLAKNDKVEKKLRVFNIFSQKEFLYRVKLKYEENNGEKVIEFSGNEDSAFDMVSFRKKMREDLGLGADKAFSANVSVEGKYIFDKSLKSFTVTMKTTGGKYLDKEYIILLERELGAADE